MAYSKTNWQNGITPINETNLNKVEQGIYDLGQTVNVQTAGTDLDDYIDNGIYFFDGNRTPSNVPTTISRGDGYLEVLSVGDGVLLHRWTVYRINDVYQRQKTSGTWNSWIKIGQEKNILTAGLTSNYTVQTAGTLEVLPINKQFTKIGSKLTVTTNGIKIGADINHIKISGQVYWYTGTNGANVSINLMKNGSTRFIDNNMKNIGTYIHQNIFSGIIAVSQNDVINLAINSSVASAVISNYNTGTYLTVEVVD